MDENPSQKGFQVQNLALAADMEDRLLDRRHLLASMDRLRRDTDTSGSMQTMDELNQNAANLLTSSNVRRAFDLSLETDATKAGYGHHAWAIAR